MFVRRRDYRSEGVIIGLKARSSHVAVESDDSWPKGLSIHIPKAHVLMVRKPVHVAANKTYLCRGDSGVEVTSNYWLKADVAAGRMPVYVVKAATHAPKA